MHLMLNLLRYINLNSDLSISESMQFRCLSLYMLFQDLAFKVRMILPKKKTCLASYSSS